MDKALIEHVRQSVLQAVAEGESKQFISREVTECYLLLICVEHLEKLATKLQTRQ